MYLPAFSHAVRSMYPYNEAIKPWRGTRSTRRISQPYESASTLHDRDPYSKAKPPMEFEKGEWVKNLLLLAHSFVGLMAATLQLPKDSAKELVLVYKYTKAETIASIESATDDNQIVALNVRTNLTGNKREKQVL